jgi:hypothetical protein
MTALTKDRNTPERSGHIVEPPVKGATTIYAGSLVAVDANGHAVPGATATTLKGLGRAEQNVDNSGGADGGLNVRVGRGIYRFANSAATDEITLSDVGNDCYIVDDQTVAKTSGTNTRSVAGKIYDVDGVGVWVKFS